MLRPTILDGRIRWQWLSGKHRQQIALEGRLAQATGRQVSAIVPKPAAAAISFEPGELPIHMLGFRIVTLLGPAGVPLL